MKKKNINSIILIIISLLVSLYLIFEHINAYIIPYLKISLTFIINMVAAYILDYKNLLLYFFCILIVHIFKGIKYGIYSLLFSLSSFISLNIYFIFLKNKYITYIKCFIIKLFINIIINSLLNTYFISLIYGKSIFLLLPIRLLKNIFLLPFESFIIYYIIIKLKYILKKHMLFFDHNTI